MHSTAKAAAAHISRARLLHRKPLFPAFHFEVHRFAIRLRRTCKVHLIPTPIADRGGSGSWALRGCSGSRLASHHIPQPSPLCLPTHPRDTCILLIRHHNMLITKIYDVPNRVHAVRVRVGRLGRFGAGGPGGRGASGRSYEINNGLGRASCATVSERIFSHCLLARNCIFLE